MILATRNILPSSRSILHSAYTWPKFHAYFLSTTSIQTRRFRAVVTGGTRGIGYAIAELLVRDGVDVTIIGRDENRVAKAIEMLRALGGKHEGLTCDISNEEEVENACKNISKAGDTDFLVNAAGITKDALLIQAKTSDIRSIIDVNLLGTMHMCRLLSRNMIKRHSGCIINISSVVGINGNVGQSAYSASKAAIIGFSKSLAKELAPKNVRVNVIAPGFIKTDMTTVLPEEKYASRIPLSRFGKPSEVADAAMFLMKATYITGEVLIIDGGLSL